MYRITIAVKTSIIIAVILLFIYVLMYGTIYNNNFSSFLIMWFSLSQIIFYYYGTNMTLHVSTGIRNTPQNKKLRKFLLWMYIIITLIFAIKIIWY